MPRPSSIPLLVLALGLAPGCSAPPPEPVPRPLEPAPAQPTEPGATVAAPTTASAPSAAPTPAPASPSAPTAMRINVDTEGVTLGEVMLFIAKRAHANLVVSPEVRELVTVSLPDIPWRDAVDVIAKMTRCQVEERPGGILLLTQPARVTLTLTRVPAREALERIARTAGVTLQVPAELAERRVTLQFADSPWTDAARRVLRVLGADLGLVRTTARRYALVPLDQVAQAAKDQRLAPFRAAYAGEPLIDLDVEDADLAQVMETLSKRAGRYVLVEPKVQERLSIALSRVPWRAAVELIAWLCDCDIQDLRRAPSDPPILLLSQPPRTRVQAQGAPLGALSRLLARNARLGVALPDEGARVSCDLSSLGWTAALGALARAQGLELLEEADALVLRPRSSAPAPPPAPTARPEAGDQAPPAEPEPSERLIGEAEERLDAFEREERAGHTDEMITLLSDLRGLMRRPDAPGLAAAQAAFAGWRERGRPSAAALQAVQLQLRLERGRQLLVALRSAIAERRLAALRPTFARLEQLVAEMRGEEQEVYHRNAAALLVRGKALLERGERVAAIARHPLELTAIVLPDPSQDTKPSALLNGWICAPGQEVPDAAGRPIPEVVLEEVRPGRVVLRREDARLILPLSPLPPRARGVSVVVLNCGSVFRGQVEGLERDQVTLTVGAPGTGQATQTWSFGTAPHEVRWWSRTSDRPDADYWARFDDTARYPLADRYLYLRDMEHELPREHSDLDVLVVPPK
ncbi:MAG: hypothetical protein AB7N76_13310 [Planctomycetota bacterium]